LGFKWETEFCSNAHFIIKTDDNVYVNINRLLRTTLINNRSLKISVAGICEMGSPRDTNRASKWYVASRKYPNRRYHGICYGFGYITNVHTLHKILKLYANIHLEDVYIGLCLKITRLLEEFEDTKGVIRIRISKKNRQHNGQKKKKHKRTNDDRESIHTKLKIE
jgi:hypothetical protein